MLKCGLHKCTSSCHQLLDHSKILCRTVLTQKCVHGHNQSWQCHAGAPLECFKCERDRKEAAKKAQKALEEKLKRDEKIQKYLREVARIDEEMEQITQSIKDARLDSEQKAILAQKQMDLAAARERANKEQDSKQEDPQGIHYGDPQKSSDLPVKKSPQTSPGLATSTPCQHSKLGEILKTAVEHNKSPRRRSGSARRTRKMRTILRSIR